MTKLQICGSFPFETAQGRERSSLERHGSPAAICIVFLFCAAAVIVSPAQTLTTLASFNWSDGLHPQASLIQGTDGNLYGTTSAGGTSNNCGDYSCGTVFKITPRGTLTMMHSFNNTNYDGAKPWAGLVQARDGNFYGTTSWGTVFRITPSGTLTTLYSFCRQPRDGFCTDGAYPEDGLVQASDGNFYGTTYGGGASNNCGYSGCGTVFRITPSGTLTTLHSFAGADGAIPTAGLVQATDGNFYGTTYGGYYSGNYTFGTVFRITPSGTLTTLYSFCQRNGCTDGGAPWAGLVQASDGNFYGTTHQGGTNGYGTVFKITPWGTLTTLYSFCAQSGCPDGRVPFAGLVQASDGNFYGTTYYGGTNCGGNDNYGCGTVFKITPSGALTTLYSFCPQTGCTDGAYPFAGLVQATDGNFYGTTYDGGTDGYGTVFRLTVGLGPFVETNPTSGRVGAVVIILGTNLTDATGVTFNGTAARFRVVSASEITATVPFGATTGKVKVTTPGGTWTSNVNFQVITTCPDCFYPMGQDR